MSGIATLTHSYVDKLKGYKTQLLDTRKTTPNFRLLEKEAVRIGGGVNHRFGLYDMILALWLQVIRRAFFFFAISNAYLITWMLPGRVMNRLLNATS